MFSWSKEMVRKWFNIISKTENFQTDVCVPQGVKVENRRQRKMKYENPRIIDVQNHNIFVATWNVVGRSPLEDLNLNDLFHSSAPADIYVLGFQEIVPLKAVNVLVNENNDPAKKSEDLNMKILTDFSGSSRQQNDHSISQPKLDRCLSDCDSGQVSHRPNDFYSGYNHRFNDFSINYYSRPRDYSRPGVVSWLGSSNDDNGPGSASNESGCRIPGTHQNTACLKVNRWLASF